MPFSVIPASCMIVAVLLFLAPSAQASRLDMQARVEAPQFEFRSGFWRNLHHTLYAFASNDPNAERTIKIRITSEDIAIKDGLGDSERAIWQAAVGWYASNLSGRDLLFDDGMIAIGEALNLGEEETLSEADVPTELRDVLMRAAPIYRAHWWPRHRQANADWRAAIEPLLASHGRQIASRLSRTYEVSWFDFPVPVSLTGYSNWAGAYTAIAPVRVTISTRDPRNQEIAALEILMHEASHGLIGPLREKLVSLVAIEAAKPGANAAAARPDLWHEILFYMTGKLVADAFPGYVAYADCNELWSRAWPGHDRAVLSRHLDPYLDGTGSLDEALQALVRDLMQSG